MGEFDLRRRDVSPKMERETPLGYCIDRALNRFNQGQGPEKTSTFL